MRNLFVISTLFVSSLLSFNTLAVKLTIPDIFDVLKIDGSDYSSGLFSNEIILSLNQGEHSLELKYSELFENEDDEDHTFIKSDPFIINFTVSSAKDLILSKPNFNDESTARTYAEDPTVIISASDQQQTTVTSKKVSNDKVKKVSSVAVTNTTLSVTSVATATVVAASIPVVTTKAAEKVEVSQAIKEVTNITNTNVSLEKLAMLKYWWQQASKQEKDAFKNFINKK